MTTADVTTATAAEGVRSRCGGMKRGPLPLCYAPGLRGEKQL